MDNYEILKRLPKIELHCHLDGNIRLETIADLAEKEGVSLPASGTSAFKKFVCISPECCSLKEYISKFPLYTSLMQKPEYLYRITDELLYDLSVQNVKYIEIRWAPYNHFDKGMTFEEAIESILQAMSDAREKYGILSNLILICMRSHSCETSIQVVEKGRKYLDRGVVAVDLAGNEADFPPEIHEDAFRLAKEYGYHRTVHAGETGIAKNIITSLDSLYAERIGHGTSAYRDNAALEYIKEKRIPLEVCIVSNIQTCIETYESHPIKRFLDEGIPVTVNTDAMTASDTTLEDTYRILMEKKEFSLADIKKCILNGVEACFASSEEKTYLRRIFLKEFQDIGI